MEAEIIADGDIWNVIVYQLLNVICTCCKIYLLFTFFFKHWKNVTQFNESLCEKLSLICFLLGFISDFFVGSQTNLIAQCFILCLLIYLKLKIMKGINDVVPIIDIFEKIKIIYYKHIILFLLLFVSDFLRRTDYKTYSSVLSKDGSFINNQFNANSIPNPHVTYQASGSHGVIDMKHGNTFADNLGQQNLLVTPLTFQRNYTRYYTNVRYNLVADYYISSLHMRHKFYVRVITLTEMTHPLLHNCSHFTDSGSGLSNSTVNITDRQRCSISVQDSMPFTEMTSYGINHVIRVNPGERFTYELTDFFALQRNDKIIYKINNQRVHKIQEKHFLSGCSILTYLYKTIQNMLEAVTGLVDRKNDSQKSLDICVPYDAMGYLSVNVKKEVTRDNLTCEIDLIWTAYILPLKTYLPPNFNSTNAEWLYWQEVNQDAISHWFTTLFYEVLFFVSVTVLFIILLIYIIIGQFRNLRRILNRRKRCITGLTFDFIILTSERDNEAVDCVIVSPLKQFGYNVCFPPIDVLPGESIITTLFKLADKSSKFILVTSPNFTEGSFEWRFMYEALVAQRYLNYELAYTDVIVVGLRGNVPREITQTLNKVKIIHNFLQLSRQSQDQALSKISSDFQISGNDISSMSGIIGWFLLTFPDFEI